MTLEMNNQAPTALSEMPNTKYHDSVLADWVRFYENDIREAITWRAKWFDTILKYEANNGQR